jgi:hypothetical protein
MDCVLTKLAVIGSVVFFAIPARAQSSDALIVLTTVGYLTGAADGCKVAAAESNALSGGIALAISKGQYGDQANAHTLLNNAKQKGVAEAGAKKVDCAKVGEIVREQVRSIVGK